MPRDLAQLLVEEGVATAGDVERAVARQREAGGALDTALLELGLVEEERLLGLLSRASDLPAAPRSAYEAVDARARRVFPSKVAERHGLAPFALDGRELSLVATHPLDLGLLDEISFMLSLHLSPHVGPEWRVRALIQKLYGGTLPTRLTRLAAGLPTPSPALTPPAPVPAVAPAARPGLPARPAGFTGFSRDEGEPLEPLAAALAQAAEEYELGWEEEPAPGPAAPAGGEPRAAAPAATEPPPPPLDRSAPPHWTMEKARAVLGQAGRRDEVVLATLRYARDFFEYAALFAVTRDAVAGHDALGLEEGTREVCRTVALYASDPGIFRTAIETLAPYLGPVSREAAGSVAVLDGLGRGAPRAALVYPILLRDRPVCILYADNGAAPVSARRLGDLLLFLSTVGGAFERIIRARKHRAPAEPPVEDVLVRAAPLGEMLSATGRSGEPEPAAAPWARGEVEPPVEDAQPEPAHEPAPQPQPQPEPEPEPASEPQPEPEPESESAHAAPPPLSPAGGEGQGEGAAPEPQPAPEPRPAPRVPANLDALEEAFFNSAPLPEPEPEPAPEAEEPASSTPSPQPSPPAGEREDDAQAPAAAPPPLALEDEPEPVRPGEIPPEIAAAFASVPEPPPGVVPAAPPEAPPFDPATADPATLVGHYLVTPRDAADRPQLLARLVDRADEVAPVLVEQLPGPIDVPDEALPRTPAGDQGPVLAAVAALGPAAVRPLMALLTDAAPARRRAAAALLGQAGDARAFLPLADRCFDPDPVVAEAARAALAAHRRDPAMKPVPERLRRALLSGLADRAAAAARAIAALRDAESIPLLIQALEGSDAGTAAASADALSAITMQRHGTAARKWLMWWKENRGRGRAEWLFGALTSEDRELRLMAATELREVAPSPVAYSADLEPRDREQAARAWASWFARGGHRI